MQCRFPAAGWCGSVFRTQYCILQYLYGDCIRTTLSVTHDRGSCVFGQSAELRRPTLFNSNECMWDDWACVFPVRCPDILLHHNKRGCHPSLPLLQLGFLKTPPGYFTAAFPQSLILQGTSIASFLDSSRSELHCFLARVGRCFTRPRFPTSGPSSRPAGFSWKHL